MSTSKLRKRAYHHGDLRIALLRGAGQLLEKEGPAALSVRAAARRAGVSHAAPYRHFPDRESLLAALANEGYERFARALEDGQARSGLRGRGEAYLRFALSNPQRFRLMFGGELRMERHPQLQETAKKAFAGLAGALAEHLPGAASSDASIAAWALVHGLAHLLLDERIASTMRSGRSSADFARAVLGSVRFAASSQPAA